MNSKQGGRACLLELQRKTVSRNAAQGSGLNSSTGAQKNLLKFITSQFPSKQVLRTRSQKDDESNIKRQSKASM